MTLKRKLTFVPLLISAFWLSGCTQKTPVSEPPETTTPYETAIENIEAHMNEEVRWGGIIQSVANKSDTTIVEIVQTPTTKMGRPYTDKGSKGRFKAVFAGFIDPATFAEGNMLTVIGVIEGTDIGKIGEYDYTYPLVRVDKSQQWDRAAYERQKQRSRMNVGFGWGSAGYGFGWGMGYPFGYPYDCDIYGDCQYYW